MQASHRSEVYLLPCAWNVRTDSQRSCGVELWQAQAVHGNNNMFEYARALGWAANWSARLLERRARKNPRWATFGAIYRHHEAQAN